MLTEKMSIVIYTFCFKGSSDAFSLEESPFQWYVTK